MVACVYWGTTWLSCSGGEIWKLLSVFVFAEEEN